MRRRLALALALAGTACSYVFDLPSSGVLPSEPDGAAGDAGVGDASPEDAPAPYVPPTPVPFCETQEAPFLYCGDFDDEPAPTLADIGPVQAIDGQLSFSSAVAMSPSRSLLVVAGGASAVASVSRDLAEEPDGVTLSFDLLISAWTISEAELSGLTLADATGACAVRLGATATTWTLTQRCRSGDAETAREVSDSKTSIVRGRWQRFRLGIAFTPTTNAFLEIDGARVLEVPGAAPARRARTSFDLGVTSLHDGSATLFQDNVLVTTP